jgi:hypothetical protein
LLKLRNWLSELFPKILCKTLAGFIQSQISHLYLISPVGYSR